ncbi:unnamed protein product, partial [Rotaria sordida]
MSYRNSSIEINENKSSSSLEKLILLSRRTIIYTNRKRFCYCIPLIICELIFPLFLFGIIIYFSHYLFNKTNIDENNKEKLNNYLFDLNENEKCSQNPFDEYLNNETNSKKQISFENNCLNDLFFNKYSKTNIIIRFLNKSNDSDYLFNELINDIKKKLKQTNCSLLNKTNLILWNDLSEEYKKDDYILFNENNSFNSIIDIEQLSSHVFFYNIILTMPQYNKFKEKLRKKIDYSFLQRHQHPAEQIDLFKMSFPSYLYIKIFIDSIVINLMLNEDLSIIYSWNHRSISCTSYRHHKTIPTRWSFILMEIALSIIYLFFYFIISNSIIQENNEKVKEILKIIHIQPLINYFAWALRYFFILSFITFSITVIWKMSIGGWIVFEYVSSSILLFLFIVLNIQLISYSILMGQLFNSFTRLFLLTIIIWIIMNTLAYKEFHQIYQIILCLNPYFSLIYILRHLFINERTMTHVNLNKKLYRWSPILLNLLVFIFLSIPFYWILIWYFEKVFPGQYGIGLSWNFPFSIQYWKSIRNKSILFDRKISDESLKSLPDEYEDNENPIIVQVESLMKYFPQTNRTVVKNISFNLYENQITALLGHNGAANIGKTTIMNMLCGISQQTDGSIKISNYDTRYHMDYLRQFISYCPQHDILFDLLTVEEQIEFYAIARGYSNDKEDICSNLLEAVNLTEDRNVYCKNLSGGMKRRLSIACAFIGNTRFVLLDEPSSGLDPINRRLLWRWIRSMKENRTILLSTHFMEEADALSDRIIILSNGNICANDTSTQLKRLYGSGYKLILNTNNNQDHIYLFELIKKYLINSTIEIESNNQLIIQTNEQSSQLFIDLLYQLEILKENNFILNYGLSNTTLEEVFLRIAIDQYENNELIEENQDLIEDNCFEIFNQKLIEQGYDFYLSQYEGLFIKSIRIAYRRSILLFVILLIPFIFEYFIKTTTDYESILIDIDDWSHLKEQNIYIGINQYEYDEYLFNRIISRINQRSPLANIYKLTNITTIQQLDYFYW